VIGSIYSPQLNNTRDVIVYTPPSYYENTLKEVQNVLIMHDGQNLFNDSTSFAGISWRCQDTVNEQVVEGNMEEVLIVGVYNTPDRLDEYTYSYDPCYQKNLLGQCVGGGGKGDLYLDFLVETLQPWVAPQFRFPPSDRANFGILGSSLGGLISCYAGKGLSLAHLWHCLCRLMFIFNLCAQLGPEAPFGEREVVCLPASGGTPETLTR
jgi:predicted alpha/beta superfamily hydrolase